MQLRCNRNLTGHNGAYRFILLFSFQLSFFLWTTLSLFLMFLFAFIFLSLIAHVCFSVIENECSALRFLLFKPGTPRPVTRQVPSVKGCRRTSGRQRPLASLSAQRPLSGVKWKLKKLEILDSDFRFRPRLCENVKQQQPVVNCTGFRNFSISKWEIRVSFEVLLEPMWSAVPPATNFGEFSHSLGQKRTSIIYVQRMYPVVVSLRASGTLVRAQRWHWSSALGGLL